MGDNCQCCVLPFITHCIIFYLVIKWSAKYIERSWRISNSKHLARSRDPNGATSLDLINDDGAISSENSLTVPSDHKSTLCKITLDNSFDCTAGKNGCRVSYTQDELVEAENILHDKHHISGTLVKTFKCNRHGIHLIRPFCDSTTLFSNDHKSNNKSCCCAPPRCSCKLTIYRKKKGILLVVKGKNLKVTYKDQLLNDHQEI